jgi:hypothetical protein
MYEREFMHTFQKNRKGRMIWSKCLTEGHIRGLFNRFPTEVSLRSHFSVYLYTSIFYINFPWLQIATLELLAHLAHLTHLMLYESLLIFYNLSLRNASFKNKWETCAFDRCSSTNISVRLLMTLNMNCQLAYLSEYMKDTD